jgi:predicted nucleic acid-binding Zn ribbon protein
MTWRPLPGSNADKAGTPVKQSLDQLASKLGLASTATLNTVFTNWESAVGPEVSQHAEAVSLVDGVLVVMVDHPRWATQLKWLGPQVVERLNAKAEKSEITRLDVRIKR